MTDATRVIRDLRELAALTSDDQGAQRVAWSPVWQRARVWFAEKLAALGHRAARRGRQLLADGARPIAEDRHPRLTSRFVPNGGWLDGALRVLAALGAGVYGTRDCPVTLRLVDWADEEGRFGMSLLGRRPPQAGSIRRCAGRARSERRDTR
jgi:N-carbamoyl-L-amino-acid hydrolase